MIRPFMQACKRVRQLLEQARRRSREERRGVKKRQSRARKRERGREPACCPPIHEEDSPWCAYWHCHVHRQTHMRRSLSTFTHGKILRCRALARSTSGAVRMNGMYFHPCMYSEWHLRRLAGCRTVCVHSVLRLSPCWTVILRLKVPFPAEWVGDDA